MEAYPYHAGQQAIQQEANTGPVADRLSHWVGPVAQFAEAADLIVLASLATSGDLTVAALSGPPPLVSMTSGESGLTMRLPLELLHHLRSDAACGGLVINVAAARRSRVAGMLTADGVAAQLRCSIAFTNCRKYIAPSVNVKAERVIGPARRVSLAIEDPRLLDCLAKAEMAFLATRNPAGTPDVSHRGGPAGFLSMSPADGTIQWTEYVGDGMFVSAGNLRACEQFTLLVPDLDSGDALELVGRADYHTHERWREPRSAALLRGPDPFPKQGEVRGQVLQAHWLNGFCGPRRRGNSVARVTSCSALEEQEPL
ncbi:hypothetical protein BURK2_02570 [Burkholderiales bacterium]|nr:hypothetical protein BURK2_02570 [Burkholderiales bacterium]